MSRPTTSARASGPGTARRAARRSSRIRERQPDPHVGCRTLAHLEREARGEDVGDQPAVVRSEPPRPIRARSRAPRRTAAAWARSAARGSTRNARHAIASEHQGVRGEGQIDAGQRRPGLRARAACASTTLLARSNTPAVRMPGSSRVAGRGCGREILRTRSGMLSPIQAAQSGPAHDRPVSTASPARTPARPGPTPTSATAMSGNNAPAPCAPRFPHAEAVRPDLADAPGRGELQEACHDQRDGQDHPAATSPCPSSRTNAAKYVSASRPSR